MVLFLQEELEQSKKKNANETVVHMNGIERQRNEGMNLWITELNQSLRT